MKNSILLMTLIGLFISCGSKKAPVSLNFQGISMVVGSSVEGIVLSANKSSSDESFQEVIHEGSFEKDLDSGDWTFFAYTWDGGSPMAGSLFCSKVTEVDISGSETIVDLSLTKENCLNSSVIPSDGIDTMPTPNAPYEWNFSLCNFDSAQASLESGYCGSPYEGFATGMRVMLPKLSDGNFSDGLTSQCLKLNSGSAYGTGIMLPVLPNSAIDMLIHTQTFYSDSSDTCTGADCCTGREEKYRFNSGLNQGSLDSTLSASYSNYGNSFLFNEKVIPKVLNFDASLTTLDYDTCTLVNVDLLNNGVSYINDSNFNYTPACSEGLCSFYSNSACTVAITDSTFPIGSSSQSIYVKVGSIGKVSLFNTGDGVSIGGSALNDIPVSISYADILPSTLFSLAYLGSVNNLYVSDATLTPGTYVIYETVSGNRGKFIVNSRTTDTVANDTLTFDFVTWDSGGSVVASGTNIVATASAHLDFDINAGKLGSSVPGETDVWWQELSGNLYFSTQASKPFRVIGP